MFRILMVAKEIHINSLSQWVSTVRGESTVLTTPTNKCKKITDKSIKITELKRTDLVGQVRTNKTEW